VVWPAVTGVELPLRNDVREAADMTYVGLSISRVTVKDMDGIFREWWLMQPETDDSVVSIAYTHL